jgi:hypothetical protein
MLHRTLTGLRDNVAFVCRVRGEIVEGRRIEAPPNICEKEGGVGERMSARPQSKKGPEGARYRRHIRCKNAEQPRHRI